MMVGNGRRILIILKKEIAMTDLEKLVEQIKILNDEGKTSAEITHLILDEYDSDFIISVFVESVISK